MANRKRIVYTATDKGVDGMSKDKVLYASFDEDHLKDMHEKDPNGNWRTIGESILDVEKARATALAKLDGIDRLVLNQPDYFMKKKF